MTKFYLVDLQNWGNCLLPSVESIPLKARVIRQCQSLAEAAHENARHGYVDLVFDAKGKIVQDDSWIAPKDKKENSWVRKLQKINLKIEVPKDLDQDPPRSYRSKILF
jgi:hypothetical protein